MRRVASGVIGLLGLYVVATSPYTLSFAALLVGGAIGSGGVNLGSVRVILGGLVVVLPFALALAFGFALLNWRERLATALFDDSALPTGLDERALLSAGVRILGLWVIVIAVSGLLRSGATSVSTIADALRSDTSARGVVLGQQLLSVDVNVVSYFVEFVFGLVFVLRGRRVAIWALGDGEADAQQAHRADAVS